MLNKEEGDKKKLNEKLDINQFVWELYDKFLSMPFNLKKQVVKYGPPGTGKTYQAKRQTRLHFDVWLNQYKNNKSLDYNEHTELVQFHPSFSYEDFIEGLRPTADGKLALHDGVFKAFCKRAAQWEIDFYNLTKNLSWQEATVGDLKDEIKKKLSEKDYWELILKNPSETRLIDAIPPFYFIIDEINRAELSRVFGELMYCLEYRGVEGAIKTQYAQLNTDATGMLKIGESYQFFVPHNVYLIGTMNTIDRSIESFDFALRRRFAWEEVLPDMDVLEQHLNKIHNGKWSGLAENLKKLNEAIENEPLLGADFQIGHAYLMNLNYPKNLSLKQVCEQVWKDSIQPLLQEYLRGTGREKDLLEQFEKTFTVTE